MVTGAFSIAIALINKEIGSFAAIVNGISLPVMLLSGVLLPLSMALYGCAWLRTLIRFIMWSRLIECSRLEHLEFKRRLAFLVTLGLMVVTFWWTTRVFRKAVA